MAKPWTPISLVVGTVGLGGCALGPTELAFILAIVVLLFGATRLPQLGRALGETLRSFRSATEDEEKKQRKALEDKKVAQIEDARVEPVERAGENDKEHSSKLQ